MALTAGCQQFQPEATTKIKETKEHQINIEKKKTQGRRQAQKTQPKKKKNQP